MNHPTRTGRRILLAAVLGALVGSGVGAANADYASCAAGVTCYGTPRADTIDGGFYGLYGMAGSDVVEGKSGTDAVYGIKGEDWLRGGAGPSDIIVGCEVFYYNYWT